MFERLAIDRGAILFDPRARRRARRRSSSTRTYWRARGALTEQAGGRGSIQFIDDDGAIGCFRRYLRGGMAAPSAARHYSWLGEERTRSFRELRLLARAARARAAGTAPVAARYGGDS